MKKQAFILFLLLCASAAFALELWQHPEAAERNALFLDVCAPALSFADGFAVRPAEFHLEYLLPARFPFSLGVFFKAPDPNLKSFGVRASYHIDLRSPVTDLYVFYVFDLGFLRNGVLTEYGDEAQDIRYYDFRAGVRRLIGKYVCMIVETDFKLGGLMFGLSIKLN